MKLKKSPCLFAFILIAFTSGALAQNRKLPREKLQILLNQTINNKTIFGTVVSVTKGSDTWVGSAGNLIPKSPFFIASTTKLYITAIIFQLRAEGRLQLSDPISNYLSETVLNGLHIYKGVDYSREITIEHLLAHTSGIPDYFQGKKQNGKSLLSELSGGQDQAWTFEEAIALSKTMKPHFRPGTKKKAAYSDTNFQLLGKIITHILNDKLHHIIKERICIPLGLNKTYVYLNPTDQSPVNIYYGSAPLSIPKAMSSFGADGGIVSTAEESAIFLKAFVNGTLFPTSDLIEMQKEWNNIFFPLQYGVGIMKFKLPAIFSPFKKSPVLIGHSGLSGAFSFYCPEKNIFLSGTVNQLKNPENSYKLMLKLIQCID